MLQGFLIKFTNYHEIGGQTNVQHGNTDLTDEADHHRLIRDDQYNI